MASKPPMTILLIPLRLRVSESADRARLGGLTVAGISSSIPTTRRDATRRTAAGDISAAAFTGTGAAARKTLFISPRQDHPGCAAGGTRMTSMSNG
jgi:hypothetical protein